MSASERLLIAAPMRIEARLVASGANGAHVHRTGMGPRHARHAAQALAGMPGAALLVVGFCGGLGHDLQPCEIVVADRLYAASDEGHEQVSVACGDAGAIAGALREHGLRTSVRPLVSVAKLALGERREQLRRDGAAVVDMESAWLAAGAAGRPFAVVRVVLDTPQRELLRPAMLPIALRAGRALRQTAAAMQELVREHGLHRLFPNAAQARAGGQHDGGESEV